MAKKERKKKPRSISFLIMPDDHSEPYRFKLKIGTIRILEIVGVILLVHMIFGAIFYVHYYRVHQENILLQVERAKLQRENSQIYAIAQKFEDLEGFSRRLRVALGIEAEATPSDIVSLSPVDPGQADLTANQTPISPADRDRFLGDIETAFKRVSDSKSVYHSMYRSLPTLLPVDGYISLGFDATDFSEPLGRERHFGIDIVAKRGSVVKAAGAGTIVFAGWTPDLGNLVILYHGNDLFSFYAHNLRFIRQSGKVTKGEPISLLGSSGETSSGPHLHFEIWRNGSPVNPKEFLFSLQRSQIQTEM